MVSQARPFARHQQTFMDHFVAACLSDQRVVAVFLGGSYATGTADASSDIDLSFTAAMARR